MKSIISVEPLVSIGMPAYNGDQFIRSALDSLLAQEYKNFELVISDNASTDLTLKICNEYAAFDKRINVISQKQNVGAQENFKIVLGMASGKYFMWAAVDDNWLPGFVLEMVNELERNPEAGVSMCAIDIINEDHQVLKTIRFNNENNPNNQSYFQMLKSITSPRKYNLYIYGLFKMLLLKQAILAYPNVPGLDRLFICQLSLGTRFRYVDKVLHIRMHRTKPLNLRLPEEKFSTMARDKMVNIKILGAFTQMMISSKIIPWNRKLLTPVAVWRYGVLIYSPIFRAIRSRMFTTSSISKASE
jgi:glycosyltransferase involved in cell wall biosynthesis